MLKCHNKASISCGSGSTAGALVTLLLLVLLPCVGQAAQVSLTSEDLPYTVRSYDTITISGTSISSATNGIELKGGVHDIVIDGDPESTGNKDTLFFNTGGASGNWGIKCEYSSWYGYIHNVHVKNLVIIQHEHADHYDGAGSVGITMTGSHDVTYENVDVRTYSLDAKPVANGSSIGSFRINFIGGSYNNYSKEYSNRCSFGGAAMILGTAHSDSGRTCDDGEYNWYVRGVRIDNSHHAGIVAYGKTYIVGCTVTCDVRNVRWDGAGWGEQGWVHPRSGATLNVCAGSANGYGILVNSAGQGSRVDSNVIRSGTDWGGGRGIMIENANGTMDCWVQVAGNDVDVHEGPDKYYADGENYEGRAFTIRNLDGGHSRYVHVFNNTFKVTAMNIDLDTIPIDTMVPYTASQTAFKMQSGTYGGIHANLLVENNTFIAYSIDSGCASYAFKMYGGEFDSTVIFRNNEWYSDVYPIVFRGGSPVILRSPTIGRLSPSYDDTTFMFIGWTWGNAGHLVIDPTYTDGADGSVGYALGNQTTNDITFRRTLDIVVKGGLNNEPVIGAHVTARNAYGNVVLDGYTNVNGVVSGVVTYYYETRTGTDSTAYNDFVIIATSDGDADTVIHTVAWNTSVPPLVLPNTEGGGSWEMGSVQVQVDQRRVNDTIFVDLTNSSSPIGDSVIVCFSVIGYPDSSYAGRKAVAYDPNESNRLYWTISGTEQYTVYVSAWVRDNAGNWSARTTSSRAYANTPPLPTYPE